MAASALQPLKNLNAWYNGVLAWEGLSFEFSRATLQVDYISWWWFELFTYEADGLETKGNFPCTAWEGTWVKNLGNGLPKQGQIYILLYGCAL